LSEQRHACGWCEQHTGGKEERLTPGAWSAIGPATFLASNTSQASSPYHQQAACRGAAGRSRSARAPSLHKELAQLGRLQRRPGRQMRGRIDGEEPVIAHEPQLVLGLVFRLEKTFGQEVPWPLASQMAPAASIQTVTIMACPFSPPVALWLPPGETKERSQPPLEALRRGRSPEGRTHGRLLRTSEARIAPCIAVVRILCTGSSGVHTMAMRAIMGIGAFQQARIITTGMIPCTLAVR
jgi:hypothetical protein